MGKSDRSDDTVEDSSFEGSSINPEFADRVTRLLSICIDGVCRLLPEGDGLQAKLQDLSKVLKRALRRKPVSELGKELQDYFACKKLEDDFRATEKEEMKKIVVDLTQTFKETVSCSGDFGVEMGEYVEKVQRSESLSELRAIKDAIVGDLRKIQARSQAMRDELEQYRQTTVALTRRLEQSEAKALIDSLTNTLNRNAYDLKIGQMVREFNRYKEPAALMVADIDHFKKFNDQYGHKSGDKVLISVAASIHDSIRGSDSLFRYGGEEFVVLLNKISLENAKKLAEKVCAQVEKDYFVDKELKMKVTISIGVAGFREGDTEHTLFDRADRAMYISKKNGRNRVTVAE